MNIVSLLSDQAHSFPGKEIYTHYNRRGKGSILTYGNLSRSTETLMSLFRKKGLRSGDRLMVFLPVSSRLYRILTASFAYGLTVVLISPYLSCKKINGILQRIKPVAAVSTPLLHAAAWSFKEYRKIPVRILHLPPVEKCSNVPFSFPLDKGEAPALITFTTGTTGQSKALVRSHNFLAVQNKVLSRLFQYDSAQRELVGLPVFVLNNLASGMNAVTFSSRLLKKAELLSRIVQKEELSRVSGSPSLMEALCRYAVKQGCVFGAVQQIFTGGAPVPLPLLRDMSRVFPKAQLNIVYGSTEAQPIALADGLEILDLYEQGVLEGYCAGYPVEGIEVLVVSKNASESSQGDLCTGEILVTGEHVINDYFQDAENEAKHRWQDGQGKIWHRTFDTGSFDNKGRLWLSGRVTLPWKPYLLEHKIQSLEGVTRAGSLVAGNNLHLFIERERRWKKSLLSRNILSLMKKEDLTGIDNMVVHFIKKMPLDRRHRYRVSYNELIKYV